MTLRWLVFLLLVLAPVFGETPPPVGAAPDFSKYTNALVLQPSEGAGNVARIAGRSLERYHFSRTPFKDEISSRFFERYLEVLDPQRMYFLQSDYDEFGAFKTQLDDLTMRQGDVAPAYTIFNRFLQRLDQQYAQAMEQLRAGQFKLDGDDRYVLDRKKEPRPKDLAAARRLWSDRLRFEYLAEKLNQPELPVLSSNVWKTLHKGATNKVSDLETALGKERAAQVLQAAEAGRLKSVSDLQSLLARTLVDDQRKAILDKLTRRYQRTLRTLKQYEPDEVLQLYLDSLAHAYDPHSNYFGKSELDSFSISMNLSLSGIGATLQSEDGYTVIRSLVTGGPAEKSKLIKVGDKIVAVAQDDHGRRGEWVDVVDEKLRKVVEQIRGTKGTRVHLMVIPDGADPSVRRELSIVRDEVKLEDSEAKARLVEIPAGGGRTNRVGVIDLPSFYASFPVGVGGRTSFKKSTTGDVGKLLKKLIAEKVDGVILDLRRNGGGSLEEAVNLTGLFIKEGPVVQVKDFNGRIQQDDDEDPAVLYDGPLAVLTSRFSASASEIVAGALQDYGRAVVVGDSSTHGKGTVQTIQELGMLMLDSGSNPGAIKVTIRKFYRASGASTQLKGVVPDIVLPGVNNHAEVGEASLENALPWDTIPSASFERLNRVEPHLAALRERSAERIKTDRDWTYVREDVARFRQQLEDKSVSLNLKKRLKEKAEGKARAESRKRELAARGAVEPVTYEITLKNADEPGLPAPITKTNVVAASKGDLKVLGGDAAAGQAQPRRRPAADEEDEDEEDTTTALDIHLREAERILLDLIQASGTRKGVAVAPGA